MSHQPEVPSKPVNTSRLRKSFTHLSQLAAYCCRFCAFHVAVMYSTWPRFVFRSRCRRSTKMSSCRVIEPLLTRHVGYALSCIVSMHGVYRIAFRRRRVVNNKYVILGSMPQLRKTQEAVIAVANGETVPLMLGSLSFRNSTLWNCSKL